MRIPGLKRGRLFYRWLRSRFVGRVLILGYHRIADMVQDPYSVCVTPDHFAQQLAVLHEIARPISLCRLIEGLWQNNLPERAVVLTFDDGYADTLYHAKPILEQYQIPATVFVTTGYQGQQFWWDELESIIMTVSDWSKRLDMPLYKNIEVKREEGSPGTRQQLLQSLYNQLLPLSAIEREQLMVQLRAWGEEESYEQPDRRALTSGELIELANGELITIGAHTTTHPLLAALPSMEQETEIRQSKSYLEELLEQPITSFSYPNGSCSETTITLVRESGFQCACASHNDIVWQGSDRFQLPRFWVPNWGKATFSSWLRRWLD